MARGPRSNPHLGLEEHPQRLSHTVRESARSPRRHGFRRLPLAHRHHADAERYTARTDARVARAVAEGRRIALIASPGPKASLDANGRTAMAKWLQGWDARKRALLVANVVVVQSDMMRGAITAMRWVALGNTRKIVESITVVPSEEAALAHVARAFDEAGD